MSCFSGGVITTRNEKKAQEEDLAISVRPPAEQPIILAPVVVSSQTKTQKKDVMNKKWAPKPKTPKKIWGKAALDAHVLRSMVAAEATKISGRGVSTRSRFESK
jgi:hypothetical protein